MPVLDHPPVANDSVPFTVSVAGDVVEKSARSDYAVLAGQRDRDVVVAPDKDPSATRYDRLTHDEAIARNLQVMDTAAFALCRDNSIPIVVFSVNEPGAIPAALTGRGRATFVVP